MLSFSPKAAKVMSTLLSTPTRACLGRNIWRLRSEAGIPTQKAFAELLGVPQSQVSDWENGRYSILQIRTLLHIAKVLYCSVDELLASLDPDYDAVLGGGRIPPPIPIVPEGEASPTGISRDDRARERRDMLDWVPRPGDVGDPEAYGIRLGGDSMVPAYRANTIVIASPSLRVRDGDDVYAQLASGERLVRLACTIPGGYMLQPYNHGYRVRFVRRKEIHAMHVIVYSCRHVRPTAWADQRRRVRGTARGVSAGRG